MPFIDVFSFFLSILGVYGLILYLRFLIPRYIIQPVSVQLNDTQRLLAHAEFVGAIPEASQLRIDFEISRNELTRMRMESHRAHGISQQLKLAIFHGLTWKLYTLSSQIEAIRVKVELAVDEHRLALPAAPQTAAGAEMPIPAPAPDIVIPSTNITEPTRARLATAS